MKTFLHLLQYLGKFLVEWEMFQIKVVDKIKTRILCLIIPPPRRKSLRLWDNVEKYLRSREAADNKMHARYMLGK
jgi:hypothetical protein